MLVLVICKFDKNPITNENIIAETTFLHTESKGKCLRHSSANNSTLFERSFRRRLFAYHYAVNHPRTNIVLS